MFTVFVFWKVKNLNHAQGFEHVKGYAGLAAGKLRGCSEEIVPKVLVFKEIKT